MQEIDMNAASVPGSADLSDTSRQLELLVNSVTDYAIYMLDPQGVIRTWNRGGERIKGYKASEVIGTHFSRFYTAEEVEAGLPALNLSIAAANGRYAGEGWRLRKDGTQLRASVVIDPIFDGDQLICYAKVTRDITERYEAEQRLQAAQHALMQAQKMEAIGKLTLGLAHDFNNLLTIVMNSLDLISTRVPDPRVQQLTDTAMRAAERGTLLTRQLLTFGRGNALVNEQLDVNALLRESRELLNRSVGDTVAVSFDLGDGLPIVELDKNQFEAAVLNLVCNSRDAMPNSGSITISTRLCRARKPSESESPEEDFLSVEVRDTGEGIPYENQSRVFEPFFTTKEVGRGSGLGLSQVFGFAMQSGGFALLESQPGQGTSVRMLLPVENRAGK